MNLVQSLFDGLKDRVKNPIVPAFVFSWLLVNFDRLFVLLASEQSAEQRMHDFNTGGTLCSALAPLVLAVIYVLGMPWVALGIQKVREAPERKRREDKAAFELALTEDELALAKKRNELAREKSAPMLEERVDELENRLNRRDSDNRGQVDDELTEADRTVVTTIAASLEIGRDIARNLYLDGYRTVLSISQIGDDTARSMESKYPGIRGMIERAELVEPST